MQIPFFIPDITEAESKNVLEVLRTPFLSNGPKLLEFEKKIAQYSEVKYAVAVNSGTNALHLMVRALGIKDGDEVITTPFSFIASSNCILYERAKPVFVDIDLQSLNIDVDKIEKSITAKTKAILAVDIFGYPADWDRLEMLAQKHKLKLIEDASEALGARRLNKMAGAFGDAGCFAFYANKQITTGEGGVIVTNNENIANLCRSMRSQGREAATAFQGLQHFRLGYSFRLSEIHCALGLSQLGRIEEILAKRERVAELYNKKLKGIFAAGSITLPMVSNSKIQRSWFVYVIILNNKYSLHDRERIIMELRERGIVCNKYFPSIHLQPYYVERFGFTKGRFPVAESISERVIALPFYNNLTEEQIGYVVDNLTRLL